MVTCPEYAYLLFRRDMFPFARRPLTGHSTTALLLVVVLCTEGQRKELGLRVLVCGRGGGSNCLASVWLCCFSCLSCSSPLIALLSRTHF
jgi:hypothetical protein